MAEPRRLANGRANTEAEARNDVEDIGHAGRNRAWVGGSLTRADHPPAARWTTVAMYCPRHCGCTSGSSNTSSAAWARGRPGPVAGLGAWPAWVTASWVG